MKRARIKYKGELLTYAEIAQRTGHTAELIKSRHNHGRPLDAPRNEFVGVSLGRTPKLYEFEGAMRTYSEIARMTHLPIGTVKSRIYYGRPLGESAKGLPRFGSYDPVAGLQARSVDGRVRYDDDIYTQRLIRERGALSLEQVGHLLGVTRQRVQQIERIAFRKLLANGVSREQLERLRDQRDFLRDAEDARASSGAFALMRRVHRRHRIEARRAS